MNRLEWLKACSALGLGALLPNELLAAFSEEELKRSDFGPDFVWGVATASYQIEGAWNVDGKGESIWDHYVHHTKQVKTGETGDVACDFYNRYESDIELMKAMNIPAFRFSISWPRLLPNGTGEVNQKGIDFYNKVIDKCLKEGIEPWITCYHWDLPQVLEEKGGWTNRDVLKWFEEFVELCGRSFGDRVKKWMVFNEPQSFMMGYLVKLTAPGKFGIKSFYKAVHHITLAHAVGGKALRRTVKDGLIGTTMGSVVAETLSDKAIDQQSAVRIDAMVNRMFIEPILGMGYPVDRLPALKHLGKYFQPEDEKNLPFDFDFIGVQNYSRMLVKHMRILPIAHARPIKVDDLPLELTDMNYEVYPEGIYKIIKQYASYKNIPRIYITENGAAFKDELVDGEINDFKRVRFFKDYLAQVLKAKQEGIDIGGYFVWSFLDNFEWAEGFRPRFGIVGVDFDTQKRTIKASGKWFAAFLKDK